MGHFTALVPSGSHQQQLVVPLTDNSAWACFANAFLSKGQKAEHFLPT